MQTQERTSVAASRSRAAERKVFWLALLLLAVCSSFGCNPAVMAYFLLPFHDPKFQPDFPLVKESKETKPFWQLSVGQKKEEVKVLILAMHANANTQTTELFNADKLLAQELTKGLKQAAKENGENLTILPPHKVEEFKARHADWMHKSDYEIGKHFKVDYVISLQINRMTLFQRGSGGQLYHGQAELSVEVVDVSKTPEENPVFTKPYHCSYPTRGPEPADTSAGFFRHRFIARMARDLSRYFMPYATNDRLDID